MRRPCIIATIPANTAKHGGRVAEALTYGRKQVTRGAGNDTRRVTDLARRMMTEFDFSEKFGRLRPAGDEGAFIAESGHRHITVAEVTAEIIAQEIRRFAGDGETRARKMPTEHLDRLRHLADALIEHETFSGDKVRALLREETSRPRRNSVDQTPSGARVT